MVDYLIEERNLLKGFPQNVRNYFLNELLIYGNSCKPLTQFKIEELKKGLRKRTTNRLIIKKAYEIIERYYSNENYRKSSEIS